MIEFIKFSLIASLFTIATACVMFWLSRYDASYDDFCEKGLELYKNKNYKGALKNYNIAISKNPDKFSAYYNAGLCELKLNNYQKALKNFEIAIKIKPDDIDTKYNLGYCTMMIQDYSGAKRIFEEILDENEPDSDILFNLGYIENQLNNIEHAENFISQAIEISPEKKDYQRVYIDILEQSYDKSGNKELLQKMLNLGLELLIVYPDDEHITYIIAQSYARLGDWERSINYCERLYNKNQNSYEGCNQFGLALFCKGEISEAIKMYEHAITINPNLPDAYINLMYAYDKNGDIPSAANTAQKIIQNFPKSDMLEMAKDYLSKQNQSETIENN